jgi:hypothetical protein
VRQRLLGFRWFTSAHAWSSIEPVGYVLVAREVVAIAEMLPRPNSPLPAGEERKIRIKCGSNRDSQD